ncbi:helix-turn-helix transcriptional regulator [Aeromonas veronii]
MTQLLTQHETCKQLGISRPTLWRRRKDDPAFPQPVYIGPRAVRFKLSDVEAYIEHLAVKGGR